MVNFKDRDFRIKQLEEENLDLKAKVESLLKSNEKFKNELINRSKSERLNETRKYHDTKYRSRYQRKDTIHSKVLFPTFFSKISLYFQVYFLRLGFKTDSKRFNWTKYKSTNQVF